MKKTIQFVRGYTRKFLPQFLGEFLRDESGQDLIEYALVAGLVSLAAITAMHGLATGIGNAYTSLSSRMTAAF